MKVLERGPSRLRVRFSVVAARVPGGIHRLLEIDERLTAHSLLRRVL